MHAEPHLHAAMCESAPVAVGSFDAPVVSPAVGFAAVSSEQ